MGGPIVGDADDERDRQATVTDFVDYTEHLPADFERSLTLIREQDEAAHLSTEELHRLLVRYAGLAKDHDAQDAAQMRKQVAYLLDLIRRRRASAAAEAFRLEEEAARHYRRLQNVKEKLLALPTPPSRDPTPQPMQKSPQAKRNEGVRLTLKMDAHPRSTLPKRRMIVPGEVLPPWNPDSPVSSDYDDFDDEEEELIMPMPVVPQKKDRVRQPKVPKEPKAPKEPKPKKEKPPRLPGQVGTNVHSSVAGISTSNALSLLTPPPEDARAGSKFAPWFRLTEWEMATLRKRMKKNAIWAPSDTMIRRELVEKGRGHEAYHRAKKLADESGEQLLDEDDVPGQLSGSRDLKPGEISADTKVKAQVTVNKGMDLNVRKKEKKAMMAQQQASLAAQQTAGFASQSLLTLSASFKTLFDRPDTSPLTPTDATIRGQKRKRESAISPDLQLQAQLNADNLTSPVAKPAQKKQKALASAAAAATTPAVAGAPATPKTVTTTTTTMIPTAPPAPSPIKASPSASNTEGGAETAASTTGARKPPSQNVRRMSLTLHMPRADAKSAEAPATSRETRQSSRPSSARGSAGPMEGSIPILSPRFKSATPGPAPVPASAVSAAALGPAPTAGAQRERRSKRPAPGPVTANQEGGASVTVGKRQNAPKKKGKLNVEEGKKQEEYIDEDVDPNEPRYCICNNVSYGVMIQCENSHCEGGEWFHLDCVKLKEPPGRREKWWCPKCNPNKPQNQKKR